MAHSPAPDDAVLLDEIPDVVVVLDGDGRVLRANAAFLRMAREATLPVVGSTLADLGVAPAIADPLTAAVLGAIADGEPRTIETGGDHPDIARILELRIVPRPGSMPSSALVIARDITDVRAADAGRREAEDLLVGVADGIPGFVSRAIVDLRDPDQPTVRFDYVGPGFEEMTGHRPSGIHPLRQVTDAIHPDDFPSWLDARRSIVAGGTATSEYRLTGVDGSTRWAREHTRAVPRPDGTVAFTAVVVDITAERASREELRVREEIDTALEEQWPGIFARLVVHPDGVHRVAYVSNGAERLLGYSPAEVLALDDFTVVIHPDDRERFVAVMCGAADPGRAASVGRIVRRDGSVRWVSIRSKVRGRVDGDTVIDCTIVDTTERVKAQQAVQASLDDVRTIEAGLPGFLFRIRCAGLRPDQITLEYASAGMETVLGWSPEELGRAGMGAVAGMIDPTDHVATGRFAEAIQTAIDTGAELVQTVECRLRRRDGMTVWFRGPITVRPLPEGGALMTGFFQDATDSRRTAEALRHAEKLEGLRELAGGVAHDFNNLLTIVVGSLDLALDDVDPESDAADGIRAATEAAHRASHLTRELLTYAGRAKIRVEPIRISDVVGEISDLLRAGTPPGIRVVTDLDAQVPTVQADVASLAQVVHNLVANAAESYGETGGTIRVRTGSERLDRRELDRMTLGHVTVPGRYAVLEVSDAGTGMDDTALARMFDPFFTTKRAGRGLGLASVLGIVREHGGVIDVRSARGRGTTVRVALPIAPGSGAAAGSAQAQTAEGIGPGGPGHAGDVHGRGRRTVLIVDDDPDVRTVGRRILERAGYVVHSTSSGAAAVATFAADPATADALVLDLTMPGMDGEATLREIRRVAPGIPVVLCTGYDDQSTADRFSTLDVSSILGKPYAGDDLVAAVDAALRTRQPTD